MHGQQNIKKKHLFVVPTASSRWWRGVEQQVLFLEKHKYNIQKNTWIETYCD